MRLMRRWDEHEHEHQDVAQMSVSIKVYVQLVQLFLPADCFTSSEIVLLIEPQSFVISRQSQSRGFNREARLGDPITRAHFTGEFLTETTNQKHLITRMVVHRVERMRTPALFLFIVTVSQLLISSPASATDPEQFFKLVLNDIKGNPVHFDQFRGKTTLLVNTASQCGFTDSQMQSLKRLYDILSFGGVFNVVAAPCNEFGGQEPWEAQEIEEYYRGHFGAEFIILEKGSVTESSELWRWIRSQPGVQAPAWNFHKYLIDGGGKVVRDWSGDVSVESIFDTVQKLIEKQGKEGSSMTPMPPSTSTTTPPVVSSGSEQKEKDEL